MELSCAVPDGVVLEVVACPFGCRAGDTVAFRGKDLVSHVAGEFTVLRCKGCGLMRTSPRPTRETIGAYYPDSYAPYVYTRSQARPRGRRPLWKSMARRVIAFNSLSLPDLQPGHALELGCASGAFLSYLRDEGWTAEGVEPGAKAAEFARGRGFRVQVSSVEGMEPPERPPSLVVGWMVLEHVHDPVGALKRLASWAVAGASLVISVPNAEALPATLFGSDWYALQLPCHLWHFTPRTLRAVLHEGGWELRRVLHQRVLTDYVASAANLAERLGLQSLFDVLRPAGQSRAFVYGTYPFAVPLAMLGQTGRMTAWAIRR